MAAVGTLFCLCLLVLWVGIRVEEKRERRRNCAHEWLEPIHFAGYWTRHCRHCGYQEPWHPPREDDDGR
jgi:hypothetical protein